MNTKILCLFLSLLFTISESYRILGLFHINGKSHFKICESLMKGLAKKGHTVDVLSHFPQQEPVLRYNDLSLKGTIPLVTGNFDYNKTVALGLSLDLALNFVFKTRAISICQAAFNSTVVKNLKLSTIKYDLIITEVYSDDCMLGFGHIFKVPVIGISSSPDIPWGANRLLGNDDNPAYVPNCVSSFDHRMTFWERVQNAIMLYYSKLKHACTREPIQKLARDFYGDDLPDLQTLAKNISLLFVNTHFSVSYPRSTLPNFIEIGGIHIEKLQKLPTNLQTYLEEPEGYKGVIYFSLGSLAKSESMPNEMLKVIGDSLGQLPYKVLWKGIESELSKKVTFPKNVKILPWFPQVELLCHPNVKLFIGHGGLLGSNEAVYCGIPILGLPMFGDQFLNLKILERKGIAKFLESHKIMEHFHDTVMEMLNNKSYYEKAKEISFVYRDRLIQPIDEAIYWVEYIIRHQGAPHLRFAGSELTWYQIYLYDVTLLLLFVTLCVCGLIYNITKFIFGLTFLKKVDYVEKKLQ